MSTVPDGEEVSDDCLLSSLFLVSINDSCGDGGSGGGGGGGGGDALNALVDPAVACETYLLATEPRRIRGPTSGAMVCDLRFSFGPPFTPVEDAPEPRECLDPEVALLACDLEVGDGIVLLPTFFKAALVAGD